jgi:hypothetical protein
MFKRTAQISKILSGAANYAVKNPATEQIAVKRAAVCADCPFREHRKGLEIIKDNQIKTIEGDVCSSCGCVLSLKVRSKASKCPEGKW